MTSEFVIVVHASLLGLGVLAMLFGVMTADSRNAAMIPGDAVAMLGAAATMLGAYGLEIGAAAAWLVLVIASIRVLFSVAQAIDQPGRPRDLPLALAREKARADYERRRRLQIEAFVRRMAAAMSNRSRPANDDNPIEIISESVHDSAAASSVIDAAPPKAKARADMLLLPAPSMPAAPAFRTVRLQTPIDANALAADPDKPRLVMERLLAMLTEGKGRIAAIVVDPTPHGDATETGERTVIFSSARR